MSTKTSADLHLNRPSTRLHAPPGGASSVSFGSSPPTANTTSGTQPAGNLVPKGVVREPVTEKLPYKVVIVSATNGVNEIVMSVTKALKSEGVVNVSVVDTEEAMNVPYIAQSLCGSYDGVIVCAILTNESSTSSLAHSLTSALLQAGVMSKTPIIPGVIGAKSLLEAKVLFNDKAPSLAKSLVSVLKAKTQPQSMTTAPAPPVGEVFRPIDVTKQTSVEGLMAALRESFKKHGSNGIFGIARKFRIMDDDNSNSVDLDEFKKAIAEHAMDWNDQQIKLVFDFFDRDGNGSISYEEFLRGARDPLNDRRRQLILQAFQVLNNVHNIIVFIWC